MMKSAWGLDALSMLLVLVLLGTLQYAVADPRPDFAIKATISGTTKVVAQSNQLAASFDKVDNANVPLSAGYDVLNNMKTALLQISSGITSAGKAISTAINTLAPNSSNNVNPLFQAVTTAINALSTLLQSGLTVQLAALQLQGHYIKDKLTDGFNSIQGRLTLLSGALDRLKAGVTAARDAPGNTASAVSASNLRKYVTAKMVQDLQDALTLLNADIPLIQYINEQVQKGLGIADAFVIEIAADAAKNAADIATVFTILQADITTIGEKIGDAFVNGVTPEYEDQVADISAVQSALESLATYPTDLQPALDSLALLLDENASITLSASINSVFTAYNTDLTGSIDSASSIEEFFQDEACEALKQLVAALVGYGGYADYCFVKYATKVFNQFAIMYLLVSDCYRIETVRLERLQDLAALIVDMIIYDIEDLGEAITSCAPLNDGAPCLTLIGPYYEILATTISDKQDYLLEYITDETEHSRQRLGSCVTVARYGMVIALTPITTALPICAASGYAA